MRCKRLGAARMYEERKGLSPEELIAWWEERNREFREYVAQLRAKREHTTATPGRAA